MIESPATIGLNSIEADARYLLRSFRRPKFRTMRQWAIDEVVIPTGPYEGRRLSISRQPFAGHWFDAIDSGLFNEFVATGPSQTGKSLCCFVIPLAYHLLELNETVIAAVPDKDMVRDKWLRDIEPVIARTRYRDLIPTSGIGSKGGGFDSITFRNGASLRFITGGGSDKRRAGYTARVICFTETDGFDERVSTSREASKIEQIMARCRAWDTRDQRVFKECTVSTEDGHTWQRFEAGTASRIALPCPHCRSYVTPEREDFRGHESSETEYEARLRSSFFCPSCGEQWTEEQRARANRESLLVHKGQTAEAGRVLGEMPKTTTLGFRWSAVHNLLVSAENIGADEYAARNAIDEDNAERKMHQFIWCVPYAPINDSSAPLSMVTLQRRQSGLGKGQTPANCEMVTVGVDVNLEDLHWTAVAWGSDDRGYVIDYGTQKMRFMNQPFDLAVLDGLTALSQILGTGWTVSGPDHVGVDCRWETEAVIAALKTLPRIWRPFMGLGAGHWARRRAVPDKHTLDTVWIGEASFERIVHKHKRVLLFADANHWKTWLHNRLALEAGTDGKSAEQSIRLFATADNNPHGTFVRHLTAEREVKRFEPGRGLLKVWEPIRKANHYLDSTYIACVLRHRYRQRMQRKGNKTHQAAPQRAASLARSEASVGTFANTFERYGRG